jgi:hypothetical protein
LILGLFLLGLARSASGQPGGGDVAARQLQQQQRQQRFDELKQIEVDERLRANQDVPVEQRMLIDYGAYITLQYLSVDDKEGNNHGLRQEDFVMWGRLNLDSANEIFARARASYLGYNPGDSFDGFGSRWVNLDIDRGYYRFDLARYMGAYKGEQVPYNVTAQLGRDLVYWANGLGMGSVIDGGIFDFAWHELSLQAIAGVTPVRTVDFDTSRPDFDFNTRRGFYGGIITWSPDTPGYGRHHPFFYGVYQRDYNTRNLLVSVHDIQTRFSYNSYYLGWGSTGSIGDHILYGAEMTYEGGNGLSNSFMITQAGLAQVEQTRDDISAFATDFKLDYVFNDPHSVRLGTELITATGDHDRGSSNTTFNGNKPGTKDFAFNGFGLVNTGLAFAPEVTNLVSFRVGASAYPFGTVQSMRRMQLGTDFFVYGKLYANAAFTETTKNDRYLGVEPDIYMNWQLTSDVTLAVRYGIFFPSHTLVQHEDPRQFVYAGVTFAF